MVIFLYNLDIFVVFKQKCLDYIEKNDHKWSFFYIIYTFLFGYNTFGCPPLNGLKSKSSYNESFYKAVPVYILQDIS